MATRFDTLTRPRAGIDHRSPSRHRSVGFTLAFVGSALAFVTLIANLVAANQSDGAAAGATLAWSFGLTTTAFATLKVGIAVILIGILVRLWLRMESVKVALPALRADGDQSVETGVIETAHGAAIAGSAAPGPLPIHRMARTMWFPMLAMGAMAVVAGLIVSFAWAGDVDNVGLAAWTQGLQFLGEGMLLASIAFLLGSILGSLREGGGRLQESLGLTVKTLNMPVTAKAFVALMMAGLMLAILQFALYVFVAADVAVEAAAWFAWLGPLRELSLGLILAGIVLALVTIGNVLAFQFDRIKEIIATGN